MSTTPDALAHPTDAFLGEIMPPWLKNAPANRINTLREQFKAHARTQERLRSLLARLTPLDTFARSLLEQGLEQQLGLKVDLRQAQWREVLREFSLKPLQLPDDQVINDDQPALSRLLQNFVAAPGFYQGSGLIAADATQRLLSGDVLAIADLCRTLDIGRRYQEHLDQVFDDTTQVLLAQDKRQGLALAASLAALKGLIGEQQLILLRHFLEGTTADPAALMLRPRLLQVLGCPIEGALAFELRDRQTDSLRGVMLYMPQDPMQALRHFERWEDAGAAFASALSQTAYQTYLLHLVAVDRRPGFLMSLMQRLEDVAPDLEVGGAAYANELFVSLAAQSVQRIKDNARHLAVPTAAVDRQVQAARLRDFEAVGLNLANLAALFVPALNLVMVAQMVEQTLGGVFDSVTSWSRGHQHEALEHLLGVAESLAVAAALAGGTVLVARGFERSAFVDSLEPVALDSGAPHLWHNDLHTWRSTRLPPQARVLDNGLYGAHGRYWWRDQDDFYEVHQADGQADWRLVHPERNTGFRPALQHNGERGWRLRMQRPLEWRGASRMLGYLWPEVPRMGEVRVAQLLQVADVDEVQLRGLLVENRRLPVSLRDTLERFVVDERIDAFFEYLASNNAQGANEDYLAFCLEQAGAQALSAAQARDELLRRAPVLRNQLLAHFSRQYLRDDVFLALVQRAFPELPDAYALHLLEQASAVQRLRMEAEQRLPLPLIELARPLLQAARLSRTLEGLYLRNSYNPDTVELVFELLRKKAQWPESVNLQLYAEGASGRAILRMFPERDPTAIKVLRRREGRFEIQDYQGFEADVEIAEPAGLFEALLAVLPDTHLKRLGWEGDDRLGRLRRDLQRWLPATRTELARMMAVHDFRPWFNPGQRLPDGRVGYLLSGRGPASLAQMTIRDRVRNLFPGYDEQQVSAYLANLHRHPSSAFARLLWEEGNYQALDQRMSAWVAEDSAGERREARQAVADALRRCWRRQGDRLTDNQGQVAGMRLNLAGIAVGSLPELPERVDFSHVAQLNLASMELGGVPQDFIVRFARLHSLDLHDNALERVPAAVFHLRVLHELRLDHNQLQLDSTGVALIASLGQLRMLDLSFNDLSADRLEVDQLYRLRELRLRSARLQQVPYGLLRLAFLNQADLRDNQITALPERLFDRPVGYRNRLRLEGNPIPDDVLQALEGAHFIRAPLANRQVRNAKALWLAGLTAEERQPHALLWDQLHAEPGSGDFFQLIGELSGTSDYREAREDLSRRLWAMIAQARDDGALRRELFSLAASPRTCVDSVISCFSELEVKVYMAQALRDALPEHGQQARLGLARRLFRLDQLERLARADIEARQDQGLDVDEVEVSLAYRRGLAEALDLPGQPRTMQFGAIAGVTQQQLLVAEAQVLAAETDEALAQYISRRDFWQQYVRQTHGENFERVEQPFWERLEALSDAQQDHSSASYLDQANQLAREREAAIDAEFLRLTRAALGTVRSGGV